MTEIWISMNSFGYRNERITGNCWIFHQDAQVLIHGGGGRNRFGVQVPGKQEENKVKVGAERQLLALLTQHFILTANEKQPAAPLNVATISKQEKVSCENNRNYKAKPCIICFPKYLRMEKYLKG